MIKFLKKIASNKKGSEVVEKIAMVVVSVAIAAAAVTFIWAKVVSASDNDSDVTTASQA